MRYTDQVVIITGASAGLGAALALELGKQGAKVGLVARRAELLAELAKETEALGRRAAWAAADVADRNQIEAAVRDLEAKLGPTDLFIANAGIGGSVHLHPINHEEIEATIRINLFGAINSIHAVLPGMLKRGRGHVAAVSSLAAYRGLPGNGSYCASKAGLNGYLECLRLQLHGTGIRVTTICPGFIRTPMTASHRFRMPFLLEADDAARRILKALARGVKVYDFPWPMALLMRALRWLPDGLLVPFMRRLPSE